MLLGVVGLGSAAGRVALVGEEQGTEARALDLLEVAGGNDQVGIDVAPVEHGQPAAVGDKWFHGLSSSNQLPDVGEMAGDGGGGGHGRADQVGAAAGPLTALEIAVAGAGRPLAGLELVGVHRQAHAASRLPPLGAGLEKDAVQAFRLGLVADRFAARHDQGLDAGGGLPSLEDLGGGPQVFDPAVGARADEDDVDRDLRSSACRARAPCIRERGGPPRARRRGLHRDREPRP